MLLFTQVFVTIVSTDKISGSELLVYTMIKGHKGIAFTKVCNVKESE